jgi:4-alpha-glucanotransferase
MPRDFFQGRHAGLLVPLFSIPSRESWGIGEIGDLPRLSEWMIAAGFSFVQLLPINEMADGQNSPYSAMSAMAIDPIFISPSAVPEFVTNQERAQLKAARESATVDYGTVRALKTRAFRAAFEHFRTTEWEQNTRRAHRFKLFLERSRWWLDDYTLYREGMARATPRSDSAGTDAGTTGAGRRDPVLFLPAVARRRSVGGGPRRLRRRHLRRLSVHGQR